uniref:FBD domain-containing protein n=1 Tax=Oryza brachyantha TaxID=4533 RepID=J3MMI0_ORYBR
MPCDLSWTMFLLQAAALLDEIIILKVDKPLEAKAPSDIYGLMPKNDDVPSQVPWFQHNHLRHLEVSCSQEELHWRLVELVKKRAVKLQSIALHDECQGCDIATREHVLSGRFRNKKPVLLYVSQMIRSPIFT